MCVASCNVKYMYFPLINMKTLCTFGTYAILLDDFGYAGRGFYKMLCMLGSRERVRAVNIVRISAI